MFIVDANSTTPQVKTCGPIIPGASCSVEATLTSPAAGGPASPFECFIDNPTGALRGSICGTVRRSSNRVAGEPVLPPGQLAKGFALDIPDPLARTRGDGDRLSCLLRIKRSRR